MRKKAGGVLFRSGRVSHQPSPARLSAMQQQPQVSAEKQPRLQSARWPGLGASSSGSLRKSANPREERCGFRTWPTSEGAQTKASKTISLDSSVACECATDGKLGEEEARREDGEAPRFLSFFFFPILRLARKRTIRQCGSFPGVPAADLRRYVCVFLGRGGIRITTRIRSSTRGQISPPQGLVNSQLSILNRRRLGEGALSSLASSKAWSVRAGGRAWSSGEIGQRSGRLWLCCGFAGFLSRGR